MVRGKQKLGQLVFELLVEGKEIWIWRVLFLSAGNLEIVCERHKGDFNDSPCTEMLLAYKKIELNHSDTATTVVVAFITSDCSVVLGCGTLCEWVSHCVKGNAVSADLMEKG